MKPPFAIPIAGSPNGPVWTGREFRIGNRSERILSYDLGASGWTDELTELHEDVDDENHYINVASREHAVGSLERWLLETAPALIDIGCSSGYTLRLLQKRLPNATVIGADYVRGPLEKLGKALPDLPLIHFDLLNCPLESDAFDGLILLNVLEHIEDDAAGFRQAYRILKPGGVAVIEVPAGPGLYDIYDKQLMHFRRYRMTGLTQKIASAGFEILERSHLGFFLYPGFWIVKKRNRRYLHRSPGFQKGVVTRNMQQASHSPFLNGVMRVERWLRQRIYLPFGIRCLVTCRKPFNRAS